MDKKNNLPPSLVLSFFRWYCRFEYREEIEGDLMERFRDNVEQHGLSKANSLFIKDVILLFRPTIIGNIDQLISIKQLTTTRQNRRLLNILTTTLALLLLPMIAMLFTAEVHWDILDFIVAAILLSGTGLGLELILRKVATTRLRISLILGLFSALLLIWAELAVGLIESLIISS